MQGFLPCFWVQKWKAQLADMVVVVGLYYFKLIKRHTSSRVCGKVGKMGLLSTFPQTIQGEKEKRRGGYNSSPTTKSPSKNLSGNGDRKRKR